MTKQDVVRIAQEFLRASGGNAKEAWEATALTLLDRLNESEARVDKLADVAGRLCCEAEGMVHSRQAWKQLRDGFTGMGHNILTEKAGIWQSIHGWSQLGRAVERARAVLDELFDEAGHPMWK